MACPFVFFPPTYGQTRRTCPNRRVRGVWPFSCDQIQMNTPYGVFIRVLVIHDGQTRQNAPKRARFVVSCRALPLPLFDNNQTPPRTCPFAHVRRVWLLSTYPSHLSIENAPKQARFRCSLHSASETRRTRPKGRVRRVLFLSCQTSWAPHHP